MGQIMARYLLHEEPTRYGFLQAATWTFWHREKMTSADFGATFGSCVRA